MTYSSVSSTFILLFILNLFEGYIQRSCPIEKCRCRIKDTVPIQRFIDCENLNISHIPTAQETNEVFYEVSFRNNNIVNINEGELRKIKATEIILLGNELMQIDIGAFHGLESHLEKLALQGDGKIGVPLQAMQNLTHLRMLHLKHFLFGGEEGNKELSFIPPIQTLRLEDVHINYIRQNAFMNLKNVSSLYVDACMKNASFPAKAIQELSRLETLHWINNGVSMLPRNGFHGLRNLKLLNMSQNHIKEYEPGCFNVISSTLDYLVLSRTGFNATKLSLLSHYVWKNLQHLDLSYNDIRDIPNIFSQFPLLKYLDLSFNELSRLLPTNFANLNVLQTLNLSGNYFVQFDLSVFRPLTNLIYLNISSLQRTVNITAGAVATFQKWSLPMTKLVLSNTKIIEEELWTSLSAIPQLEILSLDRCNLTHIDNGVFQKNKNLRVLSLSHNKISLLPDDVFQGLEQSLEHLELQGNDISAISECVFQGLTSLKILDLRQNRLICDCHLSWLYKMIRKTSNLHMTPRDKTTVTIPTYVHEVICKSPAYAINRKLSMIKGLRKCKNENKCRVVSDQITKDPVISKQHFIILVAMMLALLIAFGVAFGVVLLLLKFKKSRAENAVNALYRKNRNADNT